MIESMKKFSFLIHHSDYEAFLAKLQDLGLLHIEAAESELSNENSARLVKINHIKNVVSEMEARGIEPASVQASINDGEELLSVIEEKQEKINALTQDLHQLEKEQEAMQPWGNFNPEAIEGIKAAGYNVQFLICESKNWEEEWQNSADIEVVNDNGSELYLVALTKGEKIQHANLDEVDLAYPLSYYNETLAEYSKQLDALNAELDELSVYAPSVLNNYIQEQETELDFSKALNSGTKVAEDKLIVLSGWVPKRTADDFTAEIDKEGVVYLTEDPTPEDSMPIQLKNNWFSRLFEVIGDLYTLPRANELDLTPFFAPFYMLFFGFCLGDAGYGALIMLGTLFGISKASKKVKPLLWLGFFLGVSTTVMGILGGTAFGVMFADMEATSSWLKDYQSWILSTDNLMALSLILGYVQVVFGMVLKAINLTKGYGFKFAISQIGWILIIGIALPLWGLGSQGYMDASLANMLAAVFGVVGAIPALFYNTPDKNPLVNLGSGLWETYGMASGLLGDVLSYIRLFALGLSSAILGNVFNMLAFNLSPDIPVVGILVTIIILLFGHSLNFFMALLGSFVHPLRLTFVEFYKNAGFEGGGEKYAPFKK